MPNNYYKCKQCGRDIKAPSQVEKIKCECGNSELIYQGYEDDKGWYFHYVPQEHCHYLYNSQDGGLYWYNQVDQKWSLYKQLATTMEYSAQTATQLFETQEKVSGFELGTNASFQELEYETKGTFPQSDRDSESCLKELKAWGLKTEQDRKKAVQIITAHAVGSKEEAWEILAQWNKAYTNQSISSQEVGLPTIVPSRSDYKMEEETVNELHNDNAPAMTITVDYNGHSHTLNLFSKIGGHHLIYSPTGGTQMVNGAWNNDILVRIPCNSEAPAPDIGYGNGLGWEQQFGLKIPWIYNSKTLARDRFYIVEKIPHGFNPGIKQHLDQVKSFLATMSAIGTGPDFRPDNVRFRNNGEMVLIDFSENPGVQGTNPSDFAGLMKDFTQQFADCNKADTRLYEKLREGMSPQFRKEMDNALLPWQQ